MEKEYGQDFSIFPVLNGCNDKSLEIIDRPASKHEQIKYCITSKKGKGIAFLEGLKQITAPVFAFIDIDGAISPQQINRLLPYTKSHDIIFGSRKLPNSKILEQPPMIRRINSYFANLCVNQVLQLSIRDAFCGFKIFKTEAIKKILPFLKSTNSMIDINILYAAHKNGLKIKELPIEWKYVAGSKVKLRSDIYCLMELIKIKYSYCEEFKNETK